MLSIFHAPLEARICIANRFNERISASTSRMTCTSLYQPLLIVGKPKRVSMSMDTGERYDLRWTYLFCFVFSIASWTGLAFGSAALLSML